MGLRINDLPLAAGCFTIRPDNNLRSIPFVAHAENHGLSGLIGDNGSAEGVTMGRNYLDRQPVHNTDERTAIP